MDTLLGYIKNIGFFLILVSVVCNALPENSYKKYCRLFCGFVLVVLVITPFSEFLNYEGSIGDIFKNISNQSELMELRSQLKLQEEMDMENALNQYEEALKYQLADTAAEEGLYIMDISVEYAYTDHEHEDIELTNIGIVVTDDSEGYMYEGINEDKIHIDDIEISLESEESGSREGIDEISPADRPKVIKFIDNVSELLKIDTALITIKMYGDS